VDALTSPEGSLALAIGALLLVMGYRVARPDRAREWAAVAAYAAALVAQTLGARGLLQGAVAAPGAALRIAGAVLVVVGLVMAGTAVRARRRAARTSPADAVAPGRVGPVYAGLAVVLAGQLLRDPSEAGFVVAAIAAPFLFWAALASPREPGRS